MNPTIDINSTSPVPTGKKRNTLKDFIKEKGIYLLLHLIILGLSIYLMVCISMDIFRNTAFYETSKFQKIQFWICVAFMADFIIELLLARHKWDYIKSRFLFFLVSIPYQAIVYHYGWHFSKEVMFLLRYIPLIRGGFAMAIVVSWLTYSKATGLFFSYITMLLVTVYFAGLTFYLFEHGVNPLVKNYHDAFWWASMDVTTVGSNIVAVTTVGQVLSVLLAALGMMMFPIFTVYITDMLTRHKQQGSNRYNVITIPFSSLTKDQQDEVEKDAGADIAGSSIQSQQSPDSAQPSGSQSDT